MTKMEGCGIESWTSRFPEVRRIQSNWSFQRPRKARTSTVRATRSNGSSNKIKHCRRVATRYDKLAANYLAFVQLASIRRWLRVNESAS